MPGVITPTYAMPRLQKPNIFQRNFFIVDTATILRASLEIHISYAC
jgi:hypothetical protein